jgi:hypothetical protein
MNIFVSVWKECAKGMKKKKIKIKLEFWGNNELFTQQIKNNGKKSIANEVLSYVTQKITFCT